jgi:hypothetical protein
LEYPIPSLRIFFPTTYLALRNAVKTPAWRTLTTVFLRHPRGANLKRFSLRLDYWPIKSKVGSPNHTLLRTTWAAIGMLSAGQRRRAMPLTRFSVCIARLFLSLALVSAPQAALRTKEDVAAAEINNE